jgi:hypothetical protein
MTVELTKYTISHSGTMTRHTAETLGGMHVNRNEN